MFGFGPEVGRVKGSARRTVLLIALCAFALSVVMAVGADAAQPPYEPNDSLLTAYGPLGLNQTYTAAMETTNDRDYFYFYVNTPSSAQVSITIRDLGGGIHSYDGARFEIQDAHGSGVGAGGRVDQVGDFAIANVTLTAGKYYVEVEPENGYGATYSLTTAGTDGAFGDYAPIAARCASATGVVAAIQAELAKAEAKLRAASARVNRTRRSRSRRAKRRARAAYARAKAAVASEEEALKAAAKGQKPWCFIPQ